MFIDSRIRNIENFITNNIPECEVAVMYEAGFRGFTLFDNLKKDGINCIVTSPHTVTEEKVNYQKNDTTDSRRLATNLENNDYHQCFVPSKHYEKIGSWCVY